MDDSILQKFEQAYQKRAPLRSYTNAIRIINGSGDDLDGLVLEQHHEHCVAQIFESHWFDEKEALCSFVKERLGARFFVVKDRTLPFSSNSEALQQYVWISHVCTKTHVREHNLIFAVDLNDTMNTGLFLDMRANRQLVAGFAAGRKVLNGFSYTCSFGVHCRKAGAVSVVNVDISRKILDRGLYNYELNGIVPQEHEFVRFDVMEYLKIAAKKNNMFDMIILDPPSFARSGKKTFSIKKDLPFLLDAAFQVLNPKGVIFMATNWSGMTARNLEKMMKVSAEPRVIKYEKCVGQDVDFVGSGEREDSCLIGLLMAFE